MCGSTVNVKISVIALIAIGIFVRDVDAKRFRRIIGGEDAGDNEFPWMVRLNITDENGVNRDCGGAIISSRHILTSASCLNDTVVKNIWTGTIIRNSNVAIESHTAILIMHPKYKRYVHNNITYVENDIGIVVVDENLQLDEKQNAILLTDKETAVGTTAVLSGWGLTGPSEKNQTMILQKTFINIVPVRACRTRTENQLCGWSTSRATPYYGDIGSPLVIDGRIIGILSTVWPILGGESTYTDIYYHRDWIMCVIKKNVKILHDVKIAKHFT